MHHFAISLLWDLTDSIPWSRILATPEKPTVATTKPNTKPTISLVICASLCVLMSLYYTAILIACQPTTYRQLANNPNLDPVGKWCRMKILVWRLAYIVLEIVYILNLCV